MSIVPVPTSIMATYYGTIRCHGVNWVNSEFRFCYCIVFFSAQAVPAGDCKKRVGRIFLSPSLHFLVLSQKFDPSAWISPCSPFKEPPKTRVNCRYTTGAKGFSGQGAAGYQTWAGMRSCISFRDTKNLAAASGPSLISRVPDETAAIYPALSFRWPDIL